MARQRLAAQWALGLGLLGMLTVPSALAAPQPLEASLGRLRATLGAAAAAARPPPPRVLLAQASAQAWDAVEAAARPLAARVAEAAGYGRPGGGGDDAWAAARRRRALLADGAELTAEVAAHLRSISHKVLALQLWEIEREMTDKLRAATGAPPLPPGGLPVAAAAEAATAAAEALMLDRATAFVRAALPSARARPPGRRLLADGAGGAAAAAAAAALDDVRELAAAWGDGVGRIADVVRTGAEDAWAGVVADLAALGASPRRARVLLGAARDAELLRRYGEARAAAAAARRLLAGGGGDLGDGFGAALRPPPPPGAALVEVPLDPAALAARPDALVAAAAAVEDMLHLVADIVSATLSSAAGALRYAGGGGPAADEDEALFAGELPPAAPQRRRLAQEGAAHASSSPVAVWAAEDSAAAPNASAAVGKADHPWADEADFLGGDDPLAALVRLLSAPPFSPPPPAQRVVVRLPPGALQLLVEGAPYDDAYILGAADDDFPFDAFDFDRPAAAAAAGQGQRAARQQQRAVEELPHFAALGGARAGVQRLPAGEAAAALAAAARGAGGARFQARLVVPLGDAARSPVPREPEAGGGGGSADGNPDWRWWGVALSAAAVGLAACAVGLALVAGPPTARDANPLAPERDALLERARAAAAKPPRPAAADHAPPPRPKPAAAVAVPRKTSNLPA